MNVVEDRPRRAGVDGANDAEVGAGIDRRGGVGSVERDGVERNVEVRRDVGPRRGGHRRSEHMADVAGAAVQSAEHDVQRVGIVGIESDARDVPRRQVARDVGEHYARGRPHGCRECIGGDEYLIAYGNCNVVAVGPCNVDVARACKRRQYAPVVAAILALPEVLAAARVKDAAGGRVGGKRAEIATGIACRAPRRDLGGKRRAVVGRAPDSRARRR